jgi:hypothetical protein
VAREVCLPRRLAVLETNSAYAVGVHPPIVPFDFGYTVRPDGARIYWEVGGAAGGFTTGLVNGDSGSGLAQDSVDGAAVGVGVGLIGLIA